MATTSFKWKLSAQATCTPPVNTADHADHAAKCSKSHETAYVNRGHATSTREGRWTRVLVPAHSVGPELCTNRGKSS
eukprot:CAMPEP_0168803990 /NCGR_PEP_ID=MMETSP0726-20121227/285_1 /TAXON_ID=265536 /ORGANISM="Amphiprora sp., Strain CCMP467" /LENGTH=76 /DNA_ID=CAMNT_0008855821 /DNA_START=148 /DNA_END=378 /DNA_ORIENTATION=+